LRLTQAKFNKVLFQNKQVVVAYSCNASYVGNKSMMTTMKANLGKKQEILFEE
jgi:hypothetical protein